MLVCLACPKQTHLPPTHDEHHHATLTKTGTALVPSKEHIKSFTTQLKDIVMKFSSGAYRHCRPCTAAAVRGGVADEDNQILYGYDDEKSSILVSSNSEEQDHLHHNDILREDECTGMSCQFSDSSPSSSRYDLLPMARSKRHHCHKTKTTSTSSTSSRSALTLKQLPSNPESCDAIEELLNAHFLREERILAEERSCVRRDDEQLLGVGSREDHQLLEEVQLVPREQPMEEHIDGDGDGDVHVHVNRGKRHAKLESAGKFEEWVAQVEPGVMITFVALHDGSNHLKRIRFSREMFSKWQAQLWWAENSEMVRELYSVSKSAAPFKSCASARGSSSSSTSTSSSSTASSLHHHALRNTPELQSRVGSCQSSPSQTPLVIDTLENKTYAHPQPSSSCISNFSNSYSLGGLSHEMVDHHDNPLYDTPEFELCYHEGVKDSPILQRDLWVEGHSQKLQQAKDDVIDGHDPGGLVRELKRVRFIRQLPQSSS